MSMIGTWARRAVAAGVLLGVGVAVHAGTMTPRAEAADLTLFDPGYIISDGQFYQPNAMTASQVQSFLNAKVPVCHEDWSAGPDDPIVCLKNYSQTTTAKTADAYCDGYAVKKQTAAQIIDGVARSCGVSQKVLLVLLQKETGLVTHTYPSEWRYDRATGFACPDTAPCDTQYYGFFNQVYSAARQFQKYRANPNGYGYVAGQTNLIQYHPNTACGRTSVYIQNQATAGLYNYTPYVPNKAAIAAGYGSGDSCSSYGNRNFFAFFTDWFGSTILGVDPRLEAYWTSRGGADGPGDPVAAAVSVGSGVYQEFENQVLFRSPGGVQTALARLGSITQDFLAAGGPAAWGWPQAGATRIDGIWRVPFGALTAYQYVGEVRTSKVPVHPSLERPWFSYDRRLGAVAAPRATASGVWQQFGAGNLYLTAAGTSTFLPSGWKVTVAYEEAGGPAGSWGWPLGAPATVDGATFFEFDAATAVSHDGALVPVVGTMRETWLSAGGGSKVGLPIESEVSAGGGSYQQFSTLVLLIDPEGGVQSMGTAGEITRAYLDASGPSGAWGWPEGPSTRSNGIWRVPFTYLTAYNRAGEVRTSAIPLETRLETPWFTVARPQGAVAPPVVSAEGVYQQLGAGYLYRTSAAVATFLPTGWTVTVDYLAAGGPTGEWGWPQGQATPVDDALVYPFENVTAVGRSGVLTRVEGAMREAWLAGGGTDGAGLPVADSVGTDGGWAQQFTRRYVVIDPVGRVTELSAEGPITVAYIAAGGPSGPWGWPMGGATYLNGVWKVPFTGVTAYNRWGEVRTSVIPVRPSLERPWFAYPRPGGALAEAVVLPGGAYQLMGGGYLYRSTAGRAMFGEGWKITAGYLKQGGPAGPWGWPLSDGAKVDGVYRFRFENVTVYSEKSGLRVVAVS